MRLVVDSNRFIAALIKDGLRNIAFYSPEYIFEEVEKYMPYIITKSKMSKENVELLFALFSENIETVSDYDIKRKMPEAKEIILKNKRKLVCGNPLNFSIIFEGAEIKTSQNINFVYCSSTLRET